VGTVEIPRALEGYQRIRCGDDLKDPKAHQSDLTLQTEELNTMFNLYEDSRVKEAWRLFTTKGMLRREALRPEIALSWARCQFLGLTPGKIKDIPVSPEEYHLARNNAQGLIQAAAPYFENFMAVSGYETMNLGLADSRGLILIDWIQKSDSFAYRQGISVMEDKLGTNGAALAVQQRSSYAVIGAEHYIESLQTVQSIGVPVFDQKNVLLALIAAVIPVDRNSDEVIERLEHLGSLITGSMQLQSSHQAVVHLKDHYAAALDALPEAILCFDRYGQILHGNKAAEEMYAHKILELTKFNIRELIRMDQPIKLEALLNGKCKGRILEGYYDGQGGLEPAVLECVSFNETGAVKMGMVKLSGLGYFRTQVNQWVGMRTVYRMKDIVGRSNAIMETRRQVRMAAQSEFPCLITGETGTGKKMLGQVIHSESSRCDGPYYYLNCASVPKRLIEAEIFGHVSWEDGEFDTGRMGILELAEGGTVYLDNVGEVPLQLQAKLIKYIDTGEFMKSGSDQIRNTKVRILASSRADLVLAIQRGLFRQELYTRLICNRIETIPVRHRKEDLYLLIDYLMTEILYPKDPATCIRKPSFYERLAKYDWPGNVRELQRVIQLIIYRYHGENCLEERHIIAIENEILSPSPEEELLNLEKIEHETIVKALEIAGENLSQAAKLLGIGRSTLYRKIERYGIQLYQNDSVSTTISDKQSKMIQMETF